MEFIYTDVFPNFCGDDTNTGMCIHILFATTLTLLTKGNSVKKKKKLFCKLQTFLITLNTFDVLRAQTIHKVSEYRKNVIVK